MTDTAGLRSETEDRIELEGIKIAKDELARAHSVILVLDVTDLVSDAMTYRLQQSQEADIKEVLNSSDKELIVLLNKSDLIGTDTESGKNPQIKLSSGQVIPASFVSFASTDSSFNLDLVRQKLQGVLTTQGLEKGDLMTVDSNSADNFLVTRHRHRNLLEQTI